jgi:hypothetical protein
MASQSAFCLLKPWIIVINTSFLILTSIAAIAFKAVGLAIYYKIAVGSSQSALLFTRTGSTPWLAYPPFAFGLNHTMISVFYFSCAVNLALALAVSLIVWRCLRKGPLMVTVQKLAITMLTFYRYLANGSSFSSLFLCFVA